MIEEYGHVRIKKTGITGIVVDITEYTDRTVYVVESDEKGVPGGYGGKNSWKLFWCEEEEIEEI